MQHDAGHGGLATEGAVGFMNGLDALFLCLESPQTPMHVGAMHVFEPPTGGAEGFAAAVRAHIGARLDRADVADSLVRLHRIRDASSSDRDATGIHAPPDRPARRQRAGPSVGAR